MIVIIYMRRYNQASPAFHARSFGNSHPYSTSLRMLGEVYGTYLELMEFWKSTLSIPILEVGYEDLVSDFEVSVRKMLAFCGLDWHEACRNFYESKRDVNTASYDQVRMPLYASSVGRWRNYERHLSELLEALPEREIR